MTTVINTSTSATATAYSNQRKVARTSNGVLWATWWNGSGSTTDGLSLWYSQDNGTTWNNPSTAVGFSGTGTIYAPNVSLFIDPDDYAHIAYKDRNDGFIYYRRGTPNTARTAWTWASATALFNVNALADCPDIIVHKEGTDYAAHVVFSYNPSVTINNTFYKKIAITSSGAITLDTPASTATTIGGSYGANNKTYPSIDFNHTGDSKTVAGGTPHLYVVWSAGNVGAGYGIRFKKATYAGGIWTWGAEREIDSSKYIMNDKYFLNCLFDGTRIIIGGMNTDVSYNYVMLYERDAADTATITRTLVNKATPDTVASITSCVSAGSMTYDHRGNIYLAGASHNNIATTNSFIGKWSRTTNTWSVLNVFSTTTSSSPYVSFKRGDSNSMLDLVYTDKNTSPYNVGYGSTIVNSLPTTPTNIVSSSGTVKIGDSVNISWTHNDSDGDAQAKYKFRWRKVI